VGRRPEWDTHPRQDTGGHGGTSDLDAPAYAAMQPTQATDVFSVDSEDLAETALRVVGRGPGAAMFSLFTALDVGAVG
jgi:hypothetical protein